MTALLNRPALLLTLALMLAPAARAAYPTSELLTPALGRSVSAELAQTELTQAQAALTRTQGDPLALRAELLAAQARLSQARAGVNAAGYALRLSLAQDLAALSGAEADLKVARARAEIADVNLSATELRVKAGAATRLDLDRAQTDARNARAALDRAEDGLATARENVRDRAGKLPSGTLKTFPKPSLSALQAALAGHPQQLRANAQVEAARQEVAVKANDLSAPVEVQAAREALTTAQKTAQDTGRTLRSGLSDAWQAHQTALATLASRERTQGAAAANASVQASRFAKGLISRLALLQAREDALEAGAALDAARAGVETALARLAVAANADVWK